MNPDPSVIYYLSSLDVVFFIYFILCACFRQQIKIQDQTTSRNPKSFRGVNGPTKPSSFCRASDFPSALEISGDFLFLPIRTAEVGSTCIYTDFCLGLSGKK